MIRVVTIKFRSAGKRYDFNAQNFELKAGDRVVVETDRGRALGIVVHLSSEVPRSEVPDGIKSVLRLATEEDLALAESNASREGDAFRFCQHRIAERKMEMKLVRAEYLFDGSKIIFYFTADGRVDFRELVKDLAHHFHTRIEMRQIGVRDEAKLTGGIGICGRELCCCTFLTDFTPVSVKMAKEQGLALNPNKISGQCGRLLCCLGYEFETYCNLKKGLPKCGRRVQTTEGEGVVVEQKVLTRTLTVRTEEGKNVEVPADQVEKSRRQPERPADESRRGREQSKGPAREEGEGKKPSRSRQRPQRKKQDGPPPARPEHEQEKAETSERKEGKKRSRRRRRPRRK